MDDLIKRSDAVKLLREKAEGYTVSMFATFGECWVAKTVATEAAVEIANMPTLDVAPVRHGRWVDSDIKHAVTELLEGEYPETLTCSICGFKHKFADEYGYSCIWHYCPDCGAKMDLPEPPKGVTT